MYLIAPQRPFASDRNWHSPEISGKSRLQTVAKNHSLTTDWTNCFTAQHSLSAPCQTVEFSLLDSLRAVYAIVAEPAVLFG